jgi:hypothetical protein
MSLEIESIGEVWVAIKSYIPTKDRQAAADHIAIVIADYTNDDHDLKILGEVDTYLRRAVEDYLDEDDDDEDE